MRLDLTEDAFLVFRNGANGVINVVYRRADGNIGWIDPSSPIDKGGRVADKASGKAAVAVVPVKPGGEQSQGKRSKTSS